MSTQYELNHTGAQVDSILTDAAADHASIGAAGGIAPLGADGKVAATYLPAQDATIRFAEVVRQPGATINSGRPAGTFSMVWLDSSAATDYVWKAPG
ncbi:MAG: hypothetical protein ACI305_08215, partial [Lepagella sp.]